MCCCCEAVANTSATVALEMVGAGKGANGAHNAIGGMRYGAEALANHALRRMEEIGEQKVTDHNTITYIADGVEQVTDGIIRIGDMGARIAVHTLLHYTGNDDMRVAADMGIHHLSGLLESGVDQAIAYGEQVAVDVVESDPCGRIKQVALNAVGGVTSGISSTQGLIVDSVGKTNSDLTKAVNRAIIGVEHLVTLGETTRRFSTSGNSPRVEMVSGSPTNGGDGRLSVRVRDCGGGVGLG
jgi:hypothetical protein